ncbi:sulfotransferase family protein [Tateyamaria sp.]|uniref:sulfotransferase family protein n=1 Tax=Tateyamaria sp. TaxID=1929288 RepID=UPI00329FE048
MKTQKVFGVGFHRTGTTSLQTALEVLGYSVVGMRDTEWSAYRQNDLDTIQRTVEVFDGFRDMPWPLLYQHLYKAVPNAKFILTYRDPDDWAKSCAGIYKSRPYEMFRPIYGFDSFEGNEEKAKEVYLRHISAVRQFFSDKPDVFLEKDFTKDHSWQDLCDFLLEPEPDREFPHANKRPRSLWVKLFHRGYRTAAPGAYKNWVRDRG